MRAKAPYRRSEKLDLFHLTTIGRKLGKLIFLNDFKIIGGKRVLLESEPDTHVN